MLQPRNLVLQRPPHKPSGMEKATEGPEGRARPCPISGAGKTAFNVVAALAVATGEKDILGREVTRVCSKSQPHSASNLSKILAT